ncbi:hypothetical protein OH807_31060 [Kitasatospora sp. NBC_01560]|uniref:hypothetical protein n=1 Tax=Kitasatospora sp. NBC_01560 TaxID=2975965 RepID=UPI0038634EAA
MVHCTAAELATLLERTANALHSAGFAVHHPAMATFHPASTQVSAPRVLLTVTTSDPAAGPTGFQESATPLFGELDRHEVWGLVQTGALQPDAESAMEVAAQVLAPFTRGEQADLAALNPLVAAMLDTYTRSHNDLSEITLVFREHLLLEKVNLLAGLLELGLQPSRTVVIGKPDATFYRHRVVAHLRSWGLTVLDSMDELTDRLDEFAEVSGSGPVVVVDDGGDLALEVLRSAIPPERLAVLETTAKGIRVLRRAALLERAVNLSSTSVKAAMSRTIAASCVYRFRELVRHEPTDGEECLVVGYGQLGRWVAAMLAQLGLEVRVIDPLPSARQAAEAAGFPVFPSLADAAASSVRYVFGCSGERSVDWTDVMRLSHDVVLCALSSQDLLPVIATLDRLADRSPVRAVGTRYRLDGRQVTVLADGHAINLHYAEGVSEPDFDAFTTLTGVAIVEAAAALGAGVAEPTGLVDAEFLCEVVRDLQKRSAERPRKASPALPPRSARPAEQILTAERATS